MVDNRTWMKRVRLRVGLMTDDKLLDEIALSAETIVVPRDMSRVLVPHSCEVCFDFLDYDDHPHDYKNQHWRAFFLQFRLQDVKTDDAANLQLSMFDAMAIRASSITGFDLNTDVISDIAQLKDGLEFAPEIRKKHWIDVYQRKKAYRAYTFGKMAGPRRNFERLFVLLSLFKPDTPLTRLPDG